MSLLVGVLLPLNGSSIASAATHGHFDGPGAVAVCAGRVWVTNSSDSPERPVDNSVTEINETTGAVIRVLDSDSFDFAQPVAFGCGGDHLWVVDKGFIAGEGDAVTEINATSGRLIRVVSSLSDQFDSPDAIALGGSHVWITNGATPVQPPAFGGAVGNSVTELNATTGSLVRVISDPKDKINYADAVVTLGSHVWVGSLNALSELNSSNGSLVRVIKAAGTIQSSPTALTVAGSNLWEATVSSVTERSGTTGASLRTVSADGHPHNGIDGISSNNSDVWVANIDNSVSEVNATTGKRVRVINAAADKLDDSPRHRTLR
jgi:hypothetical protein